MSRREATRAAKRLYVKAQAKGPGKVIEMPSYPGIEQLAGTSFLVLDTDRDAVTLRHLATDTELVLTGDDGIGTA